MKQCTKTKWVQEPDSSGQCRTLLVLRFPAVVEEVEERESLDRRPSSTHHLEDLLAWTLLGPWPLTNHVMARLGFKAVLVTTLF